MVASALLVQILLARSIMGSFCSRLAGRRKWGELCRVEKNHRINTYPESKGHRETGASSARSEFSVKAFLCSRMNRWLEDSSESQKMYKCF